MYVIRRYALRLNSAGSCRSPHLGLVSKTTVFNYKIQISLFGLMNLWKFGELYRQCPAVFLSQGALKNFFLVPC